MAMRRRFTASKSNTYEDFRSFPDDPEPPTSPPTLAAKAIQASAAYRNSSSHSFAYGDSVVSYGDIDNQKESKEGFWGILSRKTKEIIEDDHASQNFEHGRQSERQDSSGGQFRSRWALEKSEQPEISTSQKGSDGIRNAFEENLNIGENKTSGIFQETGKLQNRRMTLNYADALPPNNSSHCQSEYDTQLKASRDVANAMAAKAKILLRELKSVKADLAFAKERCTQLEEENKKSRESKPKGIHTADDDLIRLQLETLLAEKARLAQENSQYARENRFLREIVEFHQLTMQNVVYLDEQGIEDAIEEVDEEVDEALSIHESNLSLPSRSGPEGLSPVPSYRLLTNLNSRLSTSSSNLVMPTSPRSPRKCKNAETDTEGSPRSPTSPAGSDTAKRHSRSTTIV